MPHKLKTYLLPVLVTFAITGHTQYWGMDSISFADLTDWTALDINTYEGSYKFGYSEGEGSLNIVVAGQVVVAQVKSAEYIEGQGWVPTFRNLTNVKITGNRFFSDETNGRFVILHGATPQTGILIENPWTDPFYKGGEFAAGDGSGKLDTPGTYPNTYSEFINSEDLSDLDPEELKIMRNEMYARYCYRFKQGGAMEQHFSKQEWYISSYADVESFLTEIEKKNLATIQEFELTQGPFSEYAKAKLLSDPADAKFISDRRTLPKLAYSEASESSVVISDKLVSGEKIVISVQRGAFVASQHKIIQKNGNNDLIDGNYPYGGQYGTPEYSITSLTITIDGRNLEIPESAYSNFYAPNMGVDDNFFLRKIEAYTSTDGQYIYLYIYGGNAAGTYFAKLVFDKTKYLTRIVADYYDLSINHSFHEGFVGF